MRQILLNLMSNAVKFSPDGSRVTVSTIAGTETVSVSVRDQGSGMTEAELAIALEPFGRIASGEGPQPEGTGLGLPIAKALAEAQHGTLTVASRKGRSTIVTLSLPAAGRARGA